MAASNSFNTICGFEALVRLGNGFGFDGAWTVREQNRLLGIYFGLRKVDEV